MFEWLNDALTWLLDALENSVLWLWEQFLHGAASVIGVIPIPDGIQTAIDSWGGLDPGVAWGLQVMQVPAGLALVMGAYLVRFVIRRIPVVG